MNRNEIISKVIGIEGDYSDHEDDSGGKTRFGITEQVAREFGYEGDMRELPPYIARDIYTANYWDEMNLDRIEDFSDDLAYELFEYGVNAETHRAIKALQRVLNAFNNDQQQYEDIGVDGIIGPKTLSALNQFQEVRGREGLDVICNAINGIQCAYYIELAEANPEKYETFAYGWVRHRISFNH